MAGFDAFFIEFINIGPLYIRGWVEGAGVGWVVTKAKTKKQDDTMVGWIF